MLDPFPYSEPFEKVGGHLLGLGSDADFQLGQSLGEGPQGPADAVRAGEAGVQPHRTLVQVLLVRCEADGVLEDQAATVEAARRGEAPQPIRWELARPGDGDVPKLAVRLLRMVSTRIQHREVLAAARAADPPGIVSATVTETGEGGAAWN
jgi:hypothetical protein